MLRAQDLTTTRALVMLKAEDITDLGLNLGQKKLLLAAIRQLRSNTVGASRAPDSLSAVNQAANESTRDPMASTAYTVQSSQNTPDFTDKSLDLETVSQLRSNLLDAGTSTQDTDTLQTTGMPIHPTVSDKSDRTTQDTDLLNFVGPKFPGQGTRQRAMKL